MDYLKFVGVSALMTSTTMPNSKSFGLVGYKLCEQKEMRNINPDLKTKKC